MIRFFVTGSEVDAAYARAFADIMPVRLLPLMAMRLHGDDETWAPMRDLFGTPITEPFINVVAGRLGEHHPSAGGTRFAALWTDAVTNIAIITGGGADDASRHAADIFPYSASIAIDDRIERRLWKAGAFARFIPPDADGLRDLLAQIDENPPNAALALQQWKDNNARR